MTGTDDRDVTARLTELEATVRGLTQELVSCEERIRQLEAALEEATDGAAANGSGADPATKATPGDAEAESEATPEDADEAGKDLDDIIVA